MFLEPIFKSFIKVGQLGIIDSNGNEYVFKGIGGPSATIRIHKKEVMYKLLFCPDMALGEGYMNGDITIEKGTLSDFLDICTKNQNINRSFGWLSSFMDTCLYPLRYLIQYNPLSKSKSRIAHHYDLNARLYSLFLDSDLQYSCAYFTSLEDSLDKAQLNKKRHLAAKLRVQPGQKILDIGSGWGGLALYLAKNFDVDITGLTLSEEQLKVATERARQAGLSDRVRFYLRDYREEKNQYDRIVSVGMFEHVGVPHYQHYFNQVHQLLKEDGLAIIHSIGRSTPPEGRRSWISKYIFPGGYIPALSEVMKPVEYSKLLITDMEILRHHYAETLHHWNQRFQAHREEVAQLYDERFCRMWEYYLVGSEMGFRNLGFMIFQIQLVRDVKMATLTRDYIGHEEQRLIEEHKEG